MSLFNHFKQLNLSPGQEKALSMLESFLTSTGQVFILKGYAGTGKTTLLVGLVNYLSDVGRDFELMAPTGRAAKILRDKSGEGKTIHSSIYDFLNLTAINSESSEDADHSFHYLFPVKADEKEGMIIIVDEASMISSRESRNELFTFGTNILLSDLLTYSRLSVSSNKIIFVGDPAQLPPFGDNNSYALQENYFRGLNLSVDSTELKEVKRQSNNLILLNAGRIRSVLETVKRNKLQFEYDANSFIKQPPEEISEKYVATFPKPQIGNGVIIAFSNSQCLFYNNSVREKIYPNNKEVVAGDILLINNNNYHTYGAELLNGDMAQVAEVSSLVEKQSAPVMVDEGGVKVKKNITLTFRNVVIRIPTHADDIKCKIIDTLLNSTARDLSIDEMKALYINFMMRFRLEQTQRKAQGLSVFKVGSEEFKNSLRSDLYFNAIRVKYGYAITCHKAQGGEWEKVFIDFYGRVGLKDDQLRWCYTATTRAKEICYATNAPHFNAFTKFNISEIITISQTNFPKEALNLTQVPLSPYHTENSNKCKSLKYWEIEEKLTNTPFSIVTVEGRGLYLERYSISASDEQFQIQANHKEAGFFEEFQSVTPEVGKKSVVIKLLQIINAPYKYEFNIGYIPDTYAKENLFSIIQSICNENEITITNVIDNNKQYVITYYFITTGICSYIQFFYNLNDAFTKALPKSDLGEKDDKLNILISKLKEYAL